jgi:hypothetical protein
MARAAAHHPARGSEVLIMVRAVTAIAIALAVLATPAASQPSGTPSYTPAQAQPIARPRVIVTTDIGGDPDDQQSMVRFLLYANEFDIEALIASSSRHMRDAATHPEQIEERVAAYERVLGNLRVHDPNYPSAQVLRDRIVAGAPAYGMENVGAGKKTDASNRIVEIVDRADPRPVWVLIWGGAVDLAQALHHVQATRTPAQVAQFVSKLRVYSISDQDDAGPWARDTFPDIWWIVSLHAHRQYELATWGGISGEHMYHWDIGGPDSSLVTNDWLDQHVRHGPMGALYPRFSFIMEGDTPTFLYLIPTGLNSPEHPDYGSWGGRYGRGSIYDNLWTDTADWVIGKNGNMHRTNFGTIWRWREAYQHDFAARIQWTLHRRFRDANHNPALVVNGIPGRDAVVIDAAPGSLVTLDGAGSRDPDGDIVDYRWFQYRESEAVNRNPELTLTDEGPTRISVRMPDRASATPYHIILEAKDRGDLPLFAYRRVIIRTQPETPLRPTR